MSTIHSGFSLLFSTALSLSSSLGFAQKENVAAQFFQTAERQLESKKQCLVLKLALTDLSRLSPSQLQFKRYSYPTIDKQEKIDFFTLLRKHYVGEHGKNLNQKAFLKSYQEDSARQVIEKSVSELDDCSSYAE
jgi:hypothetical protein